MIKYDLEKQIFLVERFNQLQNICLVKRVWRTKYKNIQAPFSKNILCTVSRFKKTGSVLPNQNRRRDLSQKRKVAKNIAENLVSKFPKLSLKMMAPET